ncbi:MAG: ABC transporter ATP-binding protein, partial [Candidatus Saccharimonadales bacterium]
RKQEIDRKFDEIVAFAEVDNFIDTPVKRYSTGMHVRLAFAVAAHLETEILLVDEVLAVGDAGFQKKCLGKIGEVGRAGRTVLFVSHNMGAVAELCGRAMLLHSGRKVADCGVAEAIELYTREISFADLGTVARFDPDPLLPCSFHSVRVTNPDGVDAGTFDFAQEVVLVVTYEVRRPLECLQIDVQVTRNMTDIFHSYETDECDAISPKAPGRYEARHILPGMFLKCGHYSVTIGSGTPTDCFQVFSDAVHFEIVELTQVTTLKGYRHDRAGHVISPGKWHVTQLPQGSWSLNGH